MSVKGFWVPGSSKVLQLKGAPAPARLSGVFTVAQAAQLIFPACRMGKAGNQTVAGTKDGSVALEDWRCSSPVAPNRPVAAKKQHPRHLPPLNPFSFGS